MLFQKLRAVVVIVLVKLIGHQRIVNAAVIAGFAAKILSELDAEICS